MDLNFTASIAIKVFIYKQIFELDILERKLIWNLFPQMNSLIFVSFSIFIFLSIEISKKNKIKKSKAIIILKFLINFKLLFNI